MYNNLYNYYNYYIYMSANNVRAQETGIFTRGQRVEVDDNGVWRPGVVGMLDDFTVRNTATGRNVNRQNTQVFPVTPLVGNRNIMPGDRVQFEDGRRLLPGTFVSRNYFVTIDNGMIESVPHTRIRLAAQPGVQPVGRLTNDDGEWNMTPDEVTRLLQQRWVTLNNDEDEDDEDDDEDDDDEDDDDEDNEGHRPQRAQAQPHGLAYEVHNAFADLNLPNFMTIVRRENNGASNFKDNNNVLEPIVSYINSSETTLTPEQKTRYIRNIRKPRGIIENVNAYIRGHPELKANTLEVIQFVLSQDPKYKDLYIETFENECMGGYSTGDRQSCTKGMFERIYMANKGTIEGLCFEELQSRVGASAASASAAARPASCNPVYLELYKAFTPGADIDINDIFQKWYNQFSYDAIPEGENPLTNLSVAARKKHFRNFVRQDEIMTRRIWTDREFQRKLEESIQANNIIFETLTLDVGLGRKRRNRRRNTEKKKKKKKQRKTMKKQRKTTMKRSKENIMKGKNKIIRKTRGYY